MTSRLGRLALVLSTISLFAAASAKARLPCACPGDCDTDCAIAVDELERAVNAIFDAAAHVACPAADADHNGTVAAADLLRIVAALIEPPPPCARAATATATATRAATATLAPPATRTPSPPATHTRTPTATATRAATAGTTWIARAPLAGGGRQEVGVALLDGVIYVIGGINTAQSGVAFVEAYDIAADRWALRASLPRALHHVGAAALGGRVYSVGGLAGFSFTPATDVSRYDRVADSWEPVAPLPRARGALAVAALGDRIYATGGSAASGSVSDHTVYDPATNTWTPLAPLPSARNHLAAAAIDGLLYVVGGRRDGGGQNNSAALDRYDPASDRWESLAPMPTARSGLAVAAIDGKLIALGGEASAVDPNGVFPDVELYDPVTNSWTALDPMPVARHGIGAVTFGGLIYVPGGATVAGFEATSHHDALRFE